MRNYKFRGISPEGEWVYGDLIISNKRFDAMIFNGDLYVSVDPETVGQFTGYKTGEGNEIFDGDLLSNNYGTDREAIRKVKFYNGQWIMELISGKSTVDAIVPLHSFHKLNYKIIGTIHDK